MEEIRFHGRGGQGAVTAAVLMAKAFFKAGYEVQTFPLFGVERRGAPVEAYLRLSDKKIRVRSNIYTPDHVVVMDVKLLETVDVTAGLKPGGRVLLNAANAPKDMTKFAGFRLAVVDAVKIAVKHGLGTRTHPIINTAVIGALAAILKTPPPEAVAEAILTEIDIKTAQNVDAAADGYEQVRKCE